MYDYDEIANEALIFSDDAQVEQIDYNSIHPKIEEFEGNLPKGSLIERLWVLWKMYVDYYVVGNHELKRIIFHSLLGIILTHKGYNYIVSGDTFCSTRLHTFIIQQSGTGKSQIMKAMNNFIKYINIPSRYTTHDNESYLIGSTEDEKDKDGNAVMKQGALSHLYSLCWDEGEILLSKSVPFLNVDVMTAQFQSMMDEPGEIKGKGMRQGSIGYPSNTTLIAGSYMFDQFKQVMLQKGFLQRMNVFFKIFSEEEKNRITVGIELMKLQRKPDKIQKIRQKLKQTIDEIPKCANKLYFEKDAVMKWIPIKLQIKRTHITNAYSGEKQSTLETFFNRFHNIVDKIACQHAILMGRKTIKIDDLLYGKEQAMIHLSCILACFDNVKTEAIINVEQDRKNIIKAVVNKYPGITQSQLMIELKTMKDKGRWDFGSSRTFNLLKEMTKEKTGIIRIEKGEKNVNLLHLKQ